MPDAGDRTADGICHSKVMVECFYTAGCEECRDLEEDVLPPLRELMGADLDLRMYDIFNPTNYLRLAELQEKLGVHTTERVSIYVDEQVHLGGLKAIKAELVPTVEAAALAKTEDGRRTTDGRRQRADDRPRETRGKRQIYHDRKHIGTPGECGSAIGPLSVIRHPSSEPGDTILKKRLGTWTIPAIAAAGLLDGLNPCAFATLIFFMTLLVVAGKRGRALIAVGIGFCGAVFLTYFLLGFGVFHAIQRLWAYHLAGEALRWIMVAGLVVLCLLSFKDAWAFARIGQARAMILQLPHTIRNRIHGIMRTRLTSRQLFLGSFIIGFMVTLLESVCTGQVYVPTLVYLSRQAAAGRQTLGLLTLYNVMFVTPHVLVFVAAYHGVTNERLLAWSRTNTVWSKVLLGLGFAALAGLLAWL